MPEDEKDGWALMTRDTMREEEGKKLRKPAMKGDSRFLFMGQLNYVPWPEMVVGHDGVSFRICFPGTYHFRHKVAKHVQCGNKYVFCLQSFSSFSYGGD
jgi:hypothetical protein